MLQAKSMIEKSHSKLPAIRYATWHGIECFVVNKQQESKLFSWTTNNKRQDGNRNIIIRDKVQLTPIKKNWESPVFRWFEPEHVTRRPE